MRCSSKSSVVVLAMTIEMKNVRRLCPHQEHGDRRLQVPRHGIRQLQSRWADGPAYITQCRNQTNRCYVYNLAISGQRGSLFWHAHISRGSGPPSMDPSSSFPSAMLHTCSLRLTRRIEQGGWFNADPKTVIAEALQIGGGPNYDIPTDTYKLKAKTYPLHLINAALSGEPFFVIANHSLTVINVDAIYVKPFATDLTVISPGQRTNVLLSTEPGPQKSSYVMAVSLYFTGQRTINNTTAAAILEYVTSPASSASSNSSSIPKSLTLLLPPHPAVKAT
ncbi:hypothetical protein MLD38_011573 [Melastoma candidum]|uniref:Uncharacterized protein n=1 Tax=Melastoma candidum TaxID=119954 RepID=A0ACB9R4M4_9MYRT|nr:hypothetical protein MLD38_011573 [Melastoma candidum]